MPKGRSERKAGAREAGCWHQKSPVCSAAWSKNPETVTRVSHRDLKAWREKGGMGVFLDTSYFPLQNSEHFFSFANRLLRNY